jgi:hypothetical protein
MGRQVAGKPESMQVCRGSCRQIEGQAGEAYRKAGPEAA